MRHFRIISWVVTGIFTLMFLMSLGNVISLSHRGVPFAYIIGMLAGNAVIPGIFWIINYFIEKKK